MCNQHLLHLLFNSWIQDHLHAKNSTELQSYGTVFLVENSPISTPIQQLKRCSFVYETLNHLAASSTTSQSWTWFSTVEYKLICMRKIKLNFNWISTELKVEAHWLKNLSNFLCKSFVQTWPDSECSHTVQCLDCSDLNSRCNRYHLFWHGMTLLVLMCRWTLITHTDKKSPRIHLHTAPNPTCSRWYDHEWLKADYKPDSPQPDKVFKVPNVRTPLMFTFKSYRYV